MGELWKLCITLLLVAPPRVQQAWSPIQTKVGENVALPKCHVTGFPVPVISRRKLPVSLSKDRTSQVEGTFDCGSRPKTRHWTVRLPRQEFIRGALTVDSLFVWFVPTFKARLPQNFPKVFGMTWLLDCSPPSSISWRRFKGARDASMRDSTRRVKKISKLKEADYGVFICEANLLFSTIEARNEVVVKGK